MISTVFLLYAFGHLVLFVLSLLAFRRWRQPATVPLLLVTAGLVYGNLMLALGGTIGFGPRLETLSVPRFFLHAVSTPLLMLTGLGLARRAGSRLAAMPLVGGLVVLLTLAMIAAGFHLDMLELRLEPQQEGDLVSYGNAAAAGVPLAPVATIAVLILAGLETWRQGGGIWLLLGALLQLAAAALAGLAPVLGNLGELALLAGLVMTDWQLSQRAAPAGEVQSPRR